MKWRIMTIQHQRGTIIFMIFRCTISILDLKEGNIEEATFCHESFNANEAPWHDQQHIHATN